VKGKTEPFPKRGLVERGSSNSKLDSENQTTGNILLSERKPESKKPMKNREKIPYPCSRSKRRGNSQVNRKGESGYSPYHLRQVQGEKQRKTSAAFTKGFLVALKKRTIRFTRPILEMGREAGKRKKKSVKKNDLGCRGERPERWEEITQKGDAVEKKDHLKG